MPFHPDTFSFPLTPLVFPVWLEGAACWSVAMESTGVYWKPVFNLLEPSVKVVLATRIVKKLERLGFKVTIAREDA